MKTILLLITCFLTACSNLSPDGVGLIVTADSICISGMTGASTEACINHKTKKAYIRYADGTVDNFKVVGGGLFAGKLILQLESGGRITVSRDGGVVVEPPMAGRETVNGTTRKGQRCG